MINLEILLLFILYCIMIIFIGYKQDKCFGACTEDDVMVSILLGIIWPITLIIYIIKKVIIEDWK